MPKCQICGREFQPKDMRHLPCTPKYCSEDCRNEARRRRSSEWYREHTPKEVTLVCKGCGKVFKSPNRRRFYCSSECRAEQAKKTAILWRAEAEKHTYTCAYCGKEFESISTSAKYCSTRCKYKAAAERQTELDFDIIPAKDYARMDAKIREAKDQHLSYGQLQVRAAQEAAKLRRKNDGSRKQNGP